MRLTEFHERVAMRFGTAYGNSVLADHVLAAVGGRTAASTWSASTELP
ncbi:DUF3046 domain-containing protein [Mycolicibacter icosiumassiliensis]